MTKDVLCCIANLRPSIRVAIRMLACKGLEGVVLVAQCCIAKQEASGDGCAAWRSQVCNVG